MLFIYSVEVPLIYNRYEIGSNKPDFEMNYHFKGMVEKRITETVTIQEKTDAPVKEIEYYIDVCLCNQAENDSLLCKIEGIIADDDSVAERVAKRIADSLCKGVTIYLNKDNGNKHVFQPRLEPCWEKAKWKCKSYNGIASVKDSCFISLSKEIRLESLPIGAWLAGIDDSFVFNEYYLALGTENIKSKFFHLFAIIEYCEEVYKSENQASSYFSEKEIEDILGASLGKLPEFKRSKGKEVLCRALSSVTDIGRSTKILNILKMMNISEFSSRGETVAIDDGIIRELICLRNKTFHGTDAEYDKYMLGVEQLLYIDGMILDYISAMEL